jgi:SPP1 gp7 family putative phage head morphogenesis protein
MLSQQAGANLIRETFRVFNHAVSNGLGQEPDPAVSAALRENAFIFSGFKTHAELEQVSQMLVDEKGNIRPYNEFRQDVERINQDYNHNYLRTEYNQALQSAQMAGKWADFEKNKNFINLQYRTANDERVRASHRILHGTTLPVDDPFWKQYTPPNGWGCRCTVVAVPKDDYPVQDSHGSIAKAESCFKTPKEKMFKENLAEKKRLFPSKHPYLPKGCGECEYKKDIGLAWQPNRIWCRVCAAIRECYEREAKENKVNLKKISVSEKQRIYKKPIKDQFKTAFEGQNGGTVLIHELKDKEQMDYERVNRAAKLFADKENVLVMPEIHVSEADVRQRLGLIGKSNPDLKVGSEWVDVKSPFSIETISSNACEAQKQNAIACITDDMCILKVSDLEKYAGYVFRSQGYHQDKVYFIVDGVLYKYNRQDFK